MQKIVTVYITAQTIVVALCRRLRASEYDGWCCRATREFSRSSCTARMQSLAVLCECTKVNMIQKVFLRTKNRHDGISPRGKAQDFDSCIRWFKSNYPSCRVLVAEFSAKSGAYPRKLSRTKNRNRVRLADCGLAAKPS